MSFEWAIFTDALWCWYSLRSACLKPLNSIVEWLDFPGLDVTSDNGDNTVKETCLWNVLSRLPLLIHMLNQLYNQYAIHVGNVWQYVFSEISGKKHQIYEMFPARWLLYSYSQWRIYADIPWAVGTILNINKTTYYYYDRYNTVSGSQDTNRTSFNLALIQ